MNYHSYELTLIRTTTHINYCSYNFSYKKTVHKTYNTYNLQFIRSTKATLNYNSKKLKFAEPARIAKCYVVQKLILEEFHTTPPPRQ